MTRLTDEELRLLVLGYEKEIEELRAENALLRFNKWDAENGHKRIDTAIEKFREKVEKLRAERGRT